MDPLDALIVDLLHAADGSTQGIDELIRVLGIKLARLKAVKAGVTRRFHKLDETLRPAVPKFTKLQWRNANKEFIRDKAVKKLIKSRAKEQSKAVDEAVKELAAQSLPTADIADALRSRFLPQGLPWLFPGERFDGFVEKKTLSEKAINTRLARLRADGFVQPVSTTAKRKRAGG